MVTSNRHVQSRIGWLRMIRQSSPGTTVAVLLLLLIVVVSPLPFASVLLRDRIAFDILACLALVVAVWHHPRPMASKAFLPALLVAAVGVLGLLQSMPWPSALAGLLAPELSQSWQVTDAFLQSATDGETSGGTPLSLAPEVSRQVALHWLSAAAVLWAAGLVGGLRQHRRMIGLGVLAAATLQVVYGANLWIARSTRIWGIEVSGNPNRLRGTYINPDHLAFLLIIAITACFGWIWWSLRRALRRGPVEQRIFLTVMPGLFFLLFFAGLIFTGSRGALVAVAAACALQALVLTYYHRRWHVVLTAVGAIGFSGLAVTWFGFQGGLGRLLSTSLYEITWNHRITVYRASWDLWRDHLLTGTGLGTFRQAFPHVQPAGLDKTWNHAHSDALEILVTNGVLGFVLMLAVVLCIGRVLWRLYRFGARSEERAVGLALFGALLAALFHSLVDFGLTMPANTFILAILLASALDAPLDTAPRPRRRRSKAPRKNTDSASTDAVTTARTSTAAEASTAAG